MEKQRISGIKRIIAWVIFACAIIGCFWEVKKYPDKYFNTKNLGIGLGLLICYAVYNGWIEAVKKKKKK